VVADAGDVYLTMYDMPQAANDIHQQFTNLLSTGCKLLTIGGDHSITYPILKAYRVCNASANHLLFEWVVIKSKQVRKISIFICIVCQYQKSA